MSGNVLRTQLSLGLQITHAQIICIPEFSENLCTERFVAPIEIRPANRVEKERFDPRLCCLGQHVRRSRRNTQVLLTERDKGPPHSMLVMSCRGEL